MKTLFVFALFISVFVNFSRAEGEDSAADCDPADTLDLFSVDTGSKPPKGLCHKHTHTKIAPCYSIVVNEDAVEHTCIRVADPEHGRAFVLKLSEVKKSIPAAIARYENDEPESHAYITWHEINDRVFHVQASMGLDNTAVYIRSNGEHQVLSYEIVGYHG